MIVSAASRIVSAISLGVFCRCAPSTSAIIRSTKDSPGAAVIFTTMRSDRTVVPPVTELRSPPDSRITGADSARDGRLVDAGDALDDVAVAGDHLSGLDDDPVADLEGRAGDLLLAASQIVRRST